MLRVSDSTTEMLLADDAISFVSISTGRMCFVLVTQTVRLAIACLLLVSGAEWLAYTTSMSDMLLNAVALEFVLNIDELVFEALGPLQLKNVIDLCSSLPGPPVTRWRGIDRTACMTFVIFAGCASLIVFFWLLPYRDVLIETKSALCGGERDFVFAVGATGVPIWSLYRAPNRTAQNGSGAGYWRNGSWVEPTLKPEEDKWSETPPQQRAALDFDLEVVDLLISGFGTFKREQMNIMDASSPHSLHSCGPDIAVSYNVTDNGRMMCVSSDPGCVQKMTRLDFCEKVTIISALTINQYRTVDIDQNPILPLTEDETKCCLSAQLHSSSPLIGRFSVKRFARESVPESISAYNPRCLDVLGPRDACGGGTCPNNNLLEMSIADSISMQQCPANAATNFSGGKCPRDEPVCLDGECVKPTCSQIERFCYDDNAVGLRARQFCSATCGCANPASQLVLTDPEFGCPVNCHWSNVYLDEIESLSCQDVTAGSAALASWAGEVLRVSKNWPANWADMALRIDSVVQYGCSNVAAGKPTGFCVSSGTIWPVKPISYLCPVSCGCAGIRHVEFHMQTNSTAPITHLF